MQIDEMHGSAPQRHIALSVPDNLVGLVALYAVASVKLTELAPYVSFSVLLTFRNNQCAFGDVFAFLLHRRLHSLYKRTDGEVQG